MLLKPCLHCTFRKDCDIKRDVQKRAKGLPLTVASFKCDKRNTSFSPGDRVSAVISVWIPEPLWCSDGGYYDSVKRSATVISHIKSGSGVGKIAVWLDDGTYLKREILKLWPDRLAKLDEPPAKLCEECNKPEGKKNREGWFCETCGDIPADMEQAHL